jgi:hypothetical protein
MVFTRPSKIGQSDSHSRVTPACSNAPFFCLNSTLPEPGVETFVFQKLFVLAGFLNPASFYPEFQFILYLSLDIDLMAVLSNFNLFKRAIGDEFAPFGPIF